MPKLIEYPLQNTYDDGVQLIAIIPGVNEDFDTLRVPKSALTNYINSLISAAGGGPAGADGREIELSNNGTYILWRYQGDATWNQLIALADLKGADGANGVDGTDGESAYQIAVANGFVGTEAQWLASLKGAKGDPGNAANIAADTHYAETKATPVDADELGLIDSAGSWTLKKLTFANLKTWIAGLFVSRTNAQVDGNINLTGTTRRITGLFSGTDIAAKTAIQTNVPNAQTAFDVIPSGAANGSAIRLSNSSTPANSSILGAGINGAFAYVESGKYGSGDYLPMCFFAGAAERLRIDPTTGSILSMGGALGYGVGAGGHAYQPVSLLQPVELNKPTGTITMFSGLAAGQDVVFDVLNNMVSTTDMVLLTPQTGLLQGYLIEKDIPANGYFRIRVKNIMGTDISTVPVIGFAIIKGSRA